MIYTFYSFKGGVGRSMALANVARWFYERGLRVLMVDWDLEAPGLESYFERPGGGSDSGNGQTPRVKDWPGVIDMLLQYKRLYPRLPLPARPRDGSEAPPSTTPAVEPLAVLRKHLPSIECMLYPLAESKDGASLCLLPAGLRAEDGSNSDAGAGKTVGFSDYARAVQAFDWDGFYTSFHGEAYFNWLREQFTTYADVILIDARTGVTEMGGVCARHLADVVVSFAAPNDQNLAGVRRMARSFVRKDLETIRKAPLELVVVPARVDWQDSLLYGQFQQEFPKVFADIRNPFERLKREFWDLRIPYITKYSYMEELAITQTEGVGKELGDAYRTLALYLAYLAPETSAVRRKCASLLQERFPQLVPAIAIVSAGAANASAVQTLLDRINERGISCWHQAGDIITQQAQWLAPIMAHLRHIVVVGSEHTLVAEAVRKLYYEARQRGVWIHFVQAGSASSKPPEHLPPWLRQAQILTLDDVDPLQRQLEVRIAAPRVPHMAPPVGPYFVPRSEGTAAKEHLLSSDPATRIIALWGIGGAGKTALAAALANDDEVRARFDGGVLWASLGPAVDVAAQFETMIAAFQGSAVTPTPGEPTVRFNQRLAQLIEIAGNRLFLLVLDDLTSGDPLKPILALCRNWTILVTTRDRSVVAAESSVVIAVGEMTGEEALQLLSGQRAKSLAEAKTLAEKILPRLPLLLALARGVGDSEDMRTLEGFQADGPFGLDLWSGKQSVGNLNRSGSALLTIADCVQRLPSTSQRYLGWMARGAEGSAFQDVQKQFNLTADEVQSLFRLLRDSALATTDERSSLCSPHPLVRAYFTRPQQPPVQEDVRCLVQDILRGKSVSVEQMLDYALKIKPDSFRLARRLLQRAHKDAGFNRLPAKKQLLLVQQLALCISKDQDLPASERLDRALEILQLHADLAATKMPETLGIAGGIYKRKWEQDAQKQNLESALEYYLRGARAATPGSPDDDFGYTAINAAFLLDLLADQADGISASGTEAAAGPAAQRLQARRIREEICNTLPPMLAEKEWLRRAWWFYATLAEACLGLGRYAEARTWIVQGRATCIIPDWELESTARQLAALARRSAHVAAPASDEPNGAATSVLRVLLDGNEAALKSTLEGKVGLALSGGGFRAALFHIGVLARLAEVDLLRSVEVLSCVSGGSIIGAHYYLEVRHLLQTTADQDIRKEHYIEIVERIAASFLKGVQSNIRTRVAAELKTSWRMIWDANYTRTERLGELYEAELFSQVLDGHGDRPRFLNELRILPKGEPSFEPKKHNWRRSAKVPILILNATTLNTGHNWQFTASFMGEPPSRIDTSVDGNERLRRMYYYEAPAEYKSMRLGRAVAASACVPGLFEPLALPNMYPDRVVRLVDGGVHDNQGMAGLLEQDCAIVLISDASGQMQTVNAPAGDLLGVPLRAVGISQARVRAAQFHELNWRRRSGLLRKLMLLHLKKDLDVDPIDWTGCDEPVEASEDARPEAQRGVLTRYGIRKDVQEKLAAIRTDLDSFNDFEAYALMVSGYRMAEFEYGLCFDSQKTEPESPTETLVSQPEEVREPWVFLAVENEMKAKTNRLMSVLANANRTMFKIWTLPPAWQNALAATGVLVPMVVTFLYCLTQFDFRSSVGIAFIATMIVSLVVTAVYFAVSSGLLLRCALYGAATFPAWLHIKRFDRQYLDAGQCPVPVGSLAHIVWVIEPGGMSERVKAVIEDPQLGQWLTAHGITAATSPTSFRSIMPSSVVALDDRWLFLGAAPITDATAVTAFLQQRVAKK